MKYQHEVTHLSPTDRIRIYLVNFVFNGFLGVFLFAMFVWLVLPTTFFFEYSSSEPLVVPIAITENEVKMVSNIKANHTTGNFYWNDILRCNYEMNPDGYFVYVGQSDTSVQTSIVRKDYLAPWTYKGNMPPKRALCRMDSTVTRYVLEYIPKRQFVQSELFIIE